MRRREHVSPLDPAIERELEIVDRVLAGEAVSPSGEGSTNYGPAGDEPASDESWEDVATLIRAERPKIEPDWARELDEWAAAGFPRGEGPGGSRAGELRRSLADRLTNLLDRMPRMTAPLAGAAASLLIVAVVAVTTLNESSEPPVQDVAAVEGMSQADSASTIPESPAAEAAALSTEDQPAGGREAKDGSAALIAPDTEMPRAAFDRQSNERIAPGTANRRVDRDAQMTIAARPEKVRETSDEVISIARSVGAIVLSSQISEAGDQASATLDLRVPTRNLDTAIDRLTAIGDVDSLSESAVDITKPFVSARDRLEDAEAQRTELLEALGNAATEEEVESIRGQLRDVRREISRAESRFENVARQARWSDLAVAVRSDSTIDDERSIADWLDDAAEVLEAVAGVLLISAAIVVPIALLIWIAWSLVARARRRRRERALDA